MTSSIQVLIFATVLSLLTRVSFSITNGSMTVDPPGINLTGAKLTVVANLNQPFQDGDYFVLSDVSPGSFDPQSGQLSQCSLVTPTSGATISDCSFTTTSATVAFEVSRTTNFLIFELTGYNTPSSAGAPTTTIIHYSSAGTPKAQSLITLTNLEPDLLTSAFSSPLNDLIGAVNTEVEFGLVLNNALPSNGKVKLLLPYYNPWSNQKQQIFTSNSPGCTGLENIQTSVSCSYSSNTRELLLSNIDSQPSGTLLRFKVNSFKNPYDSRKKTGFTMQTLDSDGNPIDQTTDLFVQVTTPAGFDSLIISPQASQVDGISTYNLNYYVNLPIDANCRFKITAPAQYDLSDTFSQVTGQTTFKEAFQTASLNSATNTLTIDGCFRYFEAKQNSDLLSIYSVRNLVSVRDSEPFLVELYSVDSGTESLIATNDSSIVPSASLTQGTVTQQSLQSSGNGVIQETTDVIIEFTPSSRLPASNRVEIQFPTTDPDFAFPDTTSCSILSPKTNAVTNPTVCKIENNLVTIDNIFGNGSTLPSGTGIVFTLANLNNPVAVKDVGEFTFQTYEVINGVAYPIDFGKASGLYSADPGTMTDGLSLTSSSYTTYNSPETYTATFTPVHKIPRNGRLIVTIPVADIGIASVSGVQSQTYATTGDRARFKLSGISVSQGAGELTLVDVFSQNDYDPKVISNPQITLEIGGVRNPVSLRQSLSLKVETQDSAGNTIDVVEQGLTITMNEIGELNQVTVESSSKVNGEVATLKFTVNSKTPLVSGDYFEFAFPSDIDPPTNPSCTAGTNLSGINCLINGRTIRAQLSFSSGSLNGGSSFSFDIPNVTNPRSTKPSLPFTNIYTTDSDSYYKSGYTGAEVTVTTSVPAEVPVGIITQTSDEAGKAADYTLTYTTLNPVPSGGSFVVSYPDNVEFSGRSRICQVSVNGSIYAMTCSVSLGARKITMTNGLTIDVPADAQVQLILSQFTNPLSIDKSQSLSIQSFADSQRQYAVDVVTGGMVPGIKCELPCAGCVGVTQPTSCTLCYTDGTTDFPFLHNSSCFQECPAGFYADRSSKCQDCYSHCGSCSDFATCTTCDQKSDYKFFHEDSCLLECPSGTYVDGQNKCQPCQSPCLECTGSENGQCLSCKQTLGNPAVFLDGTTCVQNCPLGKVSENYQCKDCSNGCQTCEVNQSSCTSCKRGSYLLGTYCTAMCPSGFVSNRLSSTCEGCDPKCKICSGQDETNQVCLECQSNLVLFNTTCFSDCPDLFQRDAETGNFCEKMILPPDPIEEVKNTTVPVVVVPKYPACSSLGLSVDTGFLIYFPMILIALAIVTIAIASYCYNKKTRLTATLIAFLAPIETLALIIQVILAYHTESMWGQKCLNENNTESTYFPVVFWITLLVIILLYLLNLLFTLNFSCSKKLRNDDRFQVWKEKHCICTLTAILIACVSVSFKMSSLLYSHFLGRKRYNAQFSKQKNFFRIAHSYSLTFSIFGSAPIVLVDLAALSVYSWGSQFYIALIETLTLSLIMLVLQMVDFKHGKDRMRQEKAREQVKTMSMPPAATKMDDEFDEVDDSVRAPLKPQLEKHAIELAAIPLETQDEQVEKDSATTEDNRKGLSPLVLSHDSWNPLSQQTKKGVLSPKIDGGEKKFVYEEISEKAQLPTLSPEPEAVKEPTEQAQSTSVEEIPEAWRGGSMVSEGPLVSSNRNFNENDILGDFDRPDANQPDKIDLLKDPKDPKGFVDKKGRRVSCLGYLMDKHGNVLNQLGKAVVLQKDLYKKDEEIPLRFDLERHNFNPFDIIGNIDDTKISPTKRSNYKRDNSPASRWIHSEKKKRGVSNLNFDLNGRNINKYGFLIDGLRDGHIVNRRERKLMDRVYLQPNGDFPLLLNFDGCKFHIKDVIGDLLRDAETGDAILKQDTQSGRFYDRQGREVNKRGYLCDRKGNVKNFKGRTLFAKSAVSKDGEIPKIFAFSKFSQAKITGEFDVDQYGHPILYKDKSLGPGVFSDRTGNKVNKNGLLIDSYGNILDKKGIVVFTKSVLVMGDIPRVYRKDLGLIKFYDDGLQARKDLQPDVKIIKEVEESEAEANEATDSESESESSSVVDDTLRNPINRDFADPAQQSPAPKTPENHLRQQQDNLDTLHIDSGQSPHELPASEMSFDNSIEPGNTSLNSQMGATPADYNMANQRFFETERGDSMLSKNTMNVGEGIGPQESSQQNHGEDSRLSSHRLSQHALASIHEDQPVVIEAPAPEDQLRVVQSQQNMQTESSKLVSKEGRLDPNAQTQEQENDQALVSLELENLFPTDQAVAKENSATQGQASSLSKAPDQQWQQTEEVKAKSTDQQWEQTEAVKANSTDQQWEQTEAVKAKSTDQQWEQTEEVKAKSTDQQWEHTEEVKVKSTEDDENDLGWGVQPLNAVLRQEDRAETEADVNLGTAMNEEPVNAGTGKVEPVDDEEEKGTAVEDGTLDGEGEENDETSDDEEEDEDIRELRAAFGADRKKKHGKRRATSRVANEPTAVRSKLMNETYNNSFSSAFSHRISPPGTGRRPDKQAQLIFKGTQTAQGEPGFLTGTSFNPVGAKRKALVKKKIAQQRTSEITQPKIKLERGQDNYLNGRHQSVVFNDDEQDKFEQLKEREDRRKRHRGGRNGPHQFRTVQPNTSAEVEGPGNDTGSTVRSIPSQPDDLPSFRKLRPFNAGRLKRLEEQYLQRLPVRSERKPPLGAAGQQIGMNYTKYSGKTGFSSGVASSVRAARVATFRDTWNQVYTEPQIVAENTETKRMLNQQLKEHYLHNNDQKHLRNLKEEEKFERKQNKSFWGPPEAWVSQQQTEENAQSVARKERQKWKQVLSGGGPSSTRDESPNPNRNRHQTQDISRYDDQQKQSSPIRGINREEQLQTIMLAEHPIEKGNQSLKGTQSLQGTPDRETHPLPQQKDEPNYLTANKPSTRKGSKSRSRSRSGSPSPNARDAQNVSKCSSKHCLAARLSQMSGI